MPPTRPYVFYDTATSVCAVCLRRVEAKVLLTEDRVVMEKWCPAHGKARVLLADDAAYWRRAREVFLKPPETPLRFATETRWGCPYDCGLCPDHMQHSCLTLLELTDHCNLRCPVCFAESGPERAGFLPLAEIEERLDTIVASEGAPDVVQLSGGEPTLHPQLFAVIAAARARPIRHLMINTNGVRIANDPDFAARLADVGPGFEVYLQLDTLEEGPSRALRGADLRDVKRRALEALERHRVPTTLVMTLERGVNDGEIGAVVDLAIRTSCVRGVTLQPVQAAGRIDGVDPAAHRITLTEVRRRLLAQCAFLEPADVVPVPCNPDALAMAYALRSGTGLVPLTRYLDPQALLAGERSTIVFEREPDVRERLTSLFSLASAGTAAGALRSLLCCLPSVSAPSLRYEDVFRILIVQFLDAHSFDVRVAKRSCIHFAEKGGAMIPFDTYNLFYRGDRRLRLDALRAAVDAGNAVLPS